MIELNMHGEPDLKVPRFSFLRRHERRRRRHLRLASETGLPEATFTATR